MKIGYDISQTGALKAGCGFFAHSMLENLIDFNDAVSFVLYRNFGSDFFDPAISKSTPYRGRSISYGNSLTNLQQVHDFWQNNDIEKFLGFPDIIHSNNFWCPSQIRNTKLVYTLYDLSFLEHPQWTTEANRTICSTGVINASLYADHLIAISEYTKSSFLKFFPSFDEDKISVIYPASRFADAAGPGKSPAVFQQHSLADFFLSVGTIEPRKNQLTLLDAYSLYVKQTSNPIPLIFAGGMGWLMNDFANMISEKELQDHVFMTGYISDEELIWLYRNCRANFYASYFEGFGLPVLEGMSLGAAAVCSDRASLPEVVGDAGILINPTDKEQWAAAFCRLTHDDDRMHHMKLASVEQAQKFSWRDSADKLLKTYKTSLSD